MVPTHSQRDRGSVLPLVLVMAVVMAMVIGAIASYVTSGLAYSRVVEERSDRLAAADGGLRYAIERLSNSNYAACLSNLGNGGYTIDFPAKVNGADVKLTCTKGSNGIGDIKAWAIIMTGEGIPGNGWLLQTMAGGGKQKLLGGPVWMSDPSRTDLKAPVTLEDGDVWYYKPDCVNPSITIDSNLEFTPAYRGSICVPKPWYDVFDAPSVGSFAPAGDVANTDKPGVIDAFGCTVFSPGRYTASPVLGKNNYFQSGNYYFENVHFEITDAVVTAGWADLPRYGDKQYIANFPCEDAVTADKNSGSAAGATFYMGGSSWIDVFNKGSIEILRRLQGDSLVSIQALDATNAGAAGGIPSNLAYDDNMLYTKSGENTDLAMHGLVWAPYAKMEFGNVTNSANGQLLGGAALSRIVLQASASAQAFIIRVEGSPIKFELQLDAVATKNGNSTTMRAIVQVDDQGETAVNSLRVVDT